MTVFLLVIENFSSLICFKNWIQNLWKNVDDDRKNLIGLRKEIENKWKRGKILGSIILFFSFFLSSSLPPSNPSPKDSFRLSIIFRNPFHLWAETHHLPRNKNHEIEDELGGLERLEEVTTGRVSQISDARRNRVARKT